MARKNEHGKWIIAAGEVAEFTVCPEAWRLSLAQGAQHRRGSLRVLPDAVELSGKSQKFRSDEGQERHEGWASDVVESHKLLQGIRFVMLLLALAILVFVLSFGGVVHG